MIRINLMFYRKRFITVNFFKSFQLLTVSPASRTTSMETLQRIPYAAEVSEEQVFKKEIKPPFTPPVGVYKTFFIEAKYYFYSSYSYKIKRKERIGEAVESKVIDEKTIKSKYLERAQQESEERMRREITLNVLLSRVGRPRKM